MSESINVNPLIDSYTHAALETLGVKIADAAHTTLQCARCETSWPAERNKYGKLLRGVWKCPEGCNSKT
jgi:hypothetical protein